MESSLKQFEHLKIQIEAIRLATNNFSDENCIGKGGFGKVYKGELVHYKGQTMVALKRLNRAFGQGDPEFWKEIMTLSFYKHENIISLLGYCDDCGEKILVYEYAQNGSLDLYLDSDELTWIRRLKICIGVARGLAYLHSPMENQRVLHRDIKSSNILLDENWDAKISDFGLSKFGPANKQFTFLVSNAVGTIGYCDPLYVETGLLTKESDVYSFGVVLFEVLCGRLCIGNNNNKHRPLTGLARQYYEENKLQEIIHGNIKKEIDPNSLHVFTKIAYQCLKRERKERPLMTKIIDSLESALDYQVPSRVICGISEQEGASSTPPRPLSPLKEACSRMDLMAIHRILVMTHYRDDEEIELSFQEWTQHMRVTLEIKKRGDQAFRDKDFKSAIDFYSQFVNAGAMISLTVYARRCLCFLMCDQPDEALRDAMQAQIVNADWPTAFYLQFVALTKLDMHRDALDMLNEATQLEEKRQKDKF